MKKTTSALIASTLAFSLSGCMEGPTELCADDPEKQKIGSSKIATIFEGATEKHKVCKVSGYDLQPDTDYKYSGGLLVVKGDIPAETEITVTDGKLYVDGSVGDDAELDASVPTNWAKEKYNSMCYNVALKMSMPCKKSRTVFNGYAFDDNDPAIIVNGSVGKDVEMTSNHGISVRYAGEDTDYKQPGYASKHGYGAEEGVKSDLFIAPLVR